MSKPPLQIEIVREVCELLPVADLKNTRLSCKYLADVAAEYLLQEVHLVYTIKSIDCLREISFHPILSKNPDWQRDVCNIDYDFSSPPPIPSDENNTPEALSTWQAALEKLRRAPRRKYTKAELKKGWKRYKEVFDEQQDIEGLEEDGQMEHFAGMDDGFTLEIVMRRSEENPMDDWEDEEDEGEDDGEDDDEMWEDEPEVD